VWAQQQQLSNVVLFLFVYILYYTYSVASTITYCTVVHLAKNS